MFLAWANIRKVVGYSFIMRAHDDAGVVRIKGSFMTTLWKTQVAVKVRYIFAPNQWTEEAADPCG